MVTEEQIAKAKELYELCKSGTAPSIEVKHSVIRLYNEIYKTRYKTTTNCGSCLKTVFNGIKAIATK